MNQFEFAPKGVGKTMLGIMAALAALAVNVAMFIGAVAVIAYAVKWVLS